MPLDGLISNMGVKSRDDFKSVLTDDNGKVSPAGTSHYSCEARSWACQIVSQNLTHRVNACVVQARLGSHSSHGWCPLPHSGEPACWRDWDQGPPNCPTYPPPYLTQHRARGEWELTNKMTCGRSPRLGGRNEISQNVIKPLSRSAYQLCICRQGRIIGHRDNNDNATSAARR